MSLAIDVIPQARINNFVATPRSAPMTPRTKEKAFTQFIEAIELKSESTTSCFKKTELFIAKQMLEHCEPCIAKKWTSNCTKDLSLKELPSRIRTVKHCANCLAIIPCALICIGTAGYTLHNEEYLLPCLKKAPSTQVMQ